MITAYYHEDDKALIQLIPEENLPFIWYEFEGIIGYEIEENIDANTVDIFSLEKLKVPLLERKIEEWELIQLVNLPISDQVFTGYSTYRELDTRYKAFSSDDFKLFYSKKDGYIDCIWLLYHTFVKKGNLTMLLFTLGNRWKLCLACLGGKAVNLQNQENINEYFYLLGQE